MKNYRLNRQAETHILDDTIVSSATNKIELCENILDKIDEGVNMDELKQYIVLLADSIAFVNNMNYNSKIVKI